MFIKLWGAGGGGQAHYISSHKWQGGSGGFVEAKFLAQPGTLIVGEGGKTFSSKGTYGGGGAGGLSLKKGSSGGGLSGFFKGETPSQKNALIIAGGGGGAPYGGSDISAGRGGAAGFKRGENGTYAHHISLGGGIGATQLYPGEGGKINEMNNHPATFGHSGSSLQGGDGASNPYNTYDSGGGGGGGYFGGGGGAVSSAIDSGGGGGSGYLASSAKEAHFVDAHHAQAVNESDFDYEGTPGKGGEEKENGSDGLAVIYWIP